MLDDYATYRRSGRAFADQLDFTTTTDTTTLATAKSAAYTIYVQRIVVSIKTSAAQSLTFQDTANTPKYACKVSSSPGADTRWEFDFGPRGFACTLGKDFTVTMSAVGNAGHIEYIGYQSKVLQ